MQQLGRKNWPTGSDQQAYLVEPLLIHARGHRWRADASPVGQPRRRIGEVVGDPVDHCRDDQVRGRQVRHGTGRGTGQPGRTAGVAPRRSASCTAAGDQPTGLSRSEAAGSPSTALRGLGTRAHPLARPNLRLGAARRQVLDPVGVLGAARVPGRPDGQSRTATRTCDRTGAGSARQSARRRRASTRNPSPRRRPGTVPRCSRHTPGVSVSLEEAGGVAELSGSGMPPPSGQSARNSPSRSVASVTRRAKCCSTTARSSTSMIAFRSSQRRSR